MAMTQSLEARNHLSLGQLHAVTMSLLLGDYPAVLIQLERGNPLTGKALQRLPPEAHETRLDRLDPIITLQTQATNPNRSDLQRGKP